jgi:hypothetical protein
MRQNRPLIPHRLSRGRVPLCQREMTELSQVALANALHGSAVAKSVGKVMSYVHDRNLNPGSRYEKGVRSYLPAQCALGC